MIVGDAIRAEVFKLWRNRALVLSAFGLAPLFLLASGLVLETWSRGSGLRIAPVDPVGAALGGLSSSGNPLVQLLLIIGASVVFAGEYGWKTWRVILPRSERSAILLGKFVVFALFAGASMVACAVANGLVALYDVAVLNLDVKWPNDAGDAWMALGLAAATSVAQVTVVGGLVAVTSVASRSMLAAIAGPFLLLVGLEILGGRESLTTISPVMAALPGLASKGLRELAVHITGDPDAVGLQLAAPGAMALVVWIGVLVAATLLLFARQDLPEE